MNTQVSISIGQLKDLLEGKQVFRKDALVFFPIELVVPEFEEDKGGGL